MSAPGYDVWINTGNSGATLSFEGNLWDHLSPTRGQSGAPDRTDLVVQANGPTIDISGAQAHGRACLTGHDI
jgi:hypothetical protein